MTRSGPLYQLLGRPGVGSEAPEPRTQRERATAALSVRERIRALRQAREALPLASPVRYWSATQIAYVEDVLAGEERRLEVLQREADAPELAFEWTNPSEPVFRTRGGLWRTRSHDIGWAIWLAARSGRARLYGVTPRVAHRLVATGITATSLRTEPFAIFDLPLGGCQTIDESLERLGGEFALLVRAIEEDLARRAAELQEEVAP